MTPPVEQRVRDLRLDRRALRVEHARVAWWRRIVRARLDLAVARATGPDVLGEGVAFQLPLEVGVAVPRPAELAAVLGADQAGGDIAQLDELRSLDARLASYQAGVEAALQRATERLIANLAHDPATASQLLNRPLGRG
ncbi:hypothetical protein [Cellulomonas sp.]|uniref:hypothetical protein n=1 Tax=Cellulomonas sp. TaxID=40001 RepID=UPI001B194C47|nr:hypothetical protein [Cellulomonas sp.]MBO9555285.1 hypothetical protein [Cellulomonas sp.]